MKKEDSENVNTKKKLTLRERLKDKREKAKIELSLYGIFFVAVIIFSRLMTITTSNIEDSNNENMVSFISNIKDNYEYNIKILMDNNEYKYYGKLLGNNGTINIEENNKIISYYIMNKKYYILEDDNYMLVDENEVYPYINSRYLNINIIREYLSVSSKENNVYRVKLSDIILNSESDDYIIITIDEENKCIEIDYTELFKLRDENTEKVIVNIAYSNIDKIITLDE